MKNRLYIMLAIVFAVVGCSQSKKSEAKKLLEKAQEMVQCSDFEGASSTLQMIDSLYPREFDIRREAHHLMPKVIELKTIKALEENDSLLAIEKWRGDSLSQYLRRVSNPIENYYVYKAEPSDINIHPGAYARMSPDGSLYLIVVTNRSKGNSIEISGVKSYSLPYDDYRVTQTTGGNYVLTFLEAEVDSCLKMLQNINVPVKIDVNNNGKKVSELNLSTREVESIKCVFSNAQNVRKQKLLTVNKERLESILQTSRNQYARTHRDSI